MAPAQPSAAALQITKTGIFRLIPTSQFTPTLNESRRVSIYINIIWRTTTERPRRPRRETWTDRWWRAGSMLRSAEAAIWSCWSSPRSPDSSGSRTQARDSGMCCKHCTRLGDGVASYSVEEGEEGSIDAMKQNIWPDISESEWM